MENTIQDILRSVTSALQLPTIIVLLLLMAAAVFLLGSLIAEIFTERRHLKASIPLVIDDIQGKNAQEMDEYFRTCGLLKTQKKAIHELLKRTGLNADTREALARQLLFEQQDHYDRKTKFSEVISKIAPMFGLLGTLIPLGPGLIALGQGDTRTLSESLLIAFDTTVAGLISAAVAFVVTAIRKRWYEKYIVGLETIMECILDAELKSESKGGADEA